MGMLHKYFYLYTFGGMLLLCASASSCFIECSLALSIYFIIQVDTANVTAVLDRAYAIIYNADYNNICVLQQCRRRIDTGCKCPKNKFFILQIDTMYSLPSPTWCVKGFIFLAHFFSKLSHRIYDKKWYIFVFFLQSLIYFMKHWLQTAIMYYL